MRLTVLGGAGAWPTAHQPCSGYLVEHEGFRLLVDPGYAVLPRLLALLPAHRVDAVLVSHGHPDHCADLNPLLRARVLGDVPAPPLPVHALPGALDRVLALDQVPLEHDLREFDAGAPFEVGPFRVETWSLPHFVPNAGLRLTAGGRVLSYTGDTGPTPDLVALARDADVFLAEATFPERVRPADNAPMLSTARQAGEHAAAAGADRLVLTHLWPDSDPEVSLAAAAQAFAGRLEVARPGLVVDVGQS
ncbi:ribonuclease BN (tRNA processing enzyme) [Saccharothrix coeruleofusca]|uniref:MBL fold metallo-hydrolase n=1 Tax=Saccharothrix coeruleofusca TaxID=33919 RepID=UPI001AE6C519|nr:MBL fold metallo-hydrolase [Saccharothrix coeruleofusca]MBP2339973.1 ribonuclease BN (tRNA processing enzyme) [Saccharothrix coeruleofusca]